MKKHIIFFTCLLITTIVQANSIYPCSSNIKNFSFQNNQLILTDNNSTQRFYLLTNIGKQTLWMDIAIHNGTAQAGWGSQIQPGHYSIVSMDQPRFAFSCNNQQFHATDCQKALSVCQLQTAPQRNGKPAPPGSGWVFENVQ